MSDMGVYVITNTCNNKKYVGRSIRVQARLKQHRWLLLRGRHENGHLQGAWDKYGAKHFVFEVLEGASDESTLPALERAYIEKLGTLSTEQGYNIALPLEEAQFRHAPETKARIGAAGIGRVCTKETREKMSAAHQGRVVSPEARARMSASAKETNTPEKRAKLSLARKTRAPMSEQQRQGHAAHLASPEIRRKARAGRMGHVISDETKTKISKAHQGMKASPEARAKMSLAAKARAARPEERERLARQSAAYAASRCVIAVQPAEVLT